MRVFTAFVAALLLSIVAVAPVSAQGAPDSLSVQGVLTDSLGAIIADGNYSIGFVLYKNGAFYWKEEHPSVVVQNGVFNVLLGGTEPLNALPFNAALELGIKVGSDPEMTPRTPLASAAYARALPGMYTFYQEKPALKSYNVVGGAANNVVGAGVVGSTIGGGGGIVADTSAPNQVLGDFVTVGGGAANTASGFATTVGGGAANTANGFITTVGGGRANVTFGSYVTVGGGYLNTATGSHTTVGGGDQNTASSNNATVAGGSNNSATDVGSTVGGGDQNTATAFYAAIAGGRENVASGVQAMIPGGFRNAARGVRSLAAGSRARANHDGTFVWSDGSAAASGVDSLVTSGPRQFLVKATGGISFFSNADTTTGVHLAPSAGAWAAVSDVNAKTGFGQPSPGDVLKRLADVPIQTWRYKGQDESIRHMGPMAQDFYEAFGLGIDDKHIVTVDADGVALAAIQGLYELVQEQAERITELERRLAEN